MPLRGTVRGNVWASLVQQWHPIVRYIFCDFLPVPGMPVNIFITETDTYQQMKDQDSLADIHTKTIIQRYNSPRSEIPLWISVPVFSTVQYLHYCTHIAYLSQRFRLEHFIILSTYVLHIARSGRGRPSASVGFSTAALSTNAWERVRAIHNT